MRPFFLLRRGEFVVIVIAQSLFPAAVHIIHETVTLRPEAPEIAVYYRHGAFKADKARLRCALAADKLVGLVVEMLKVCKIGARVNAKDLEAAAGQTHGKVHVLKLVELRGDGSERFCDFGKGLDPTAVIISKLVNGAYLAVLSVPVLPDVFLSGGENGKQKLRSVTAV